MKVAYFTYPSAFQNMGGGEIQLLKTREYVEKAGVHVELFDIWKSRVEDYDVLHVFSSVKDCLGLMEVAKSRDVKVVTSSVLWSDFHRALYADGGIGEKQDLLLRHAAKFLFPGMPSGRRKVLQASDLILPNSEAEKRQIARLFSIAPDKIRVVHNAVESHFANADASLYRSKYGKDAFILSVGRIEPRKNQLNLIRAVKKIQPAKLTLIGSPVSGYETYFKNCQEEGKGFVSFIPTLGHADPLLKSAYAACDLFVLPAWFETPGLAALEAALTGAKVLTTSGGSTKEYFQDFTSYLDPSNPNDIAEKIKKSLAQPKNTALKEHVMKNYSWERTASETIAAYEEALKK